MSSKSDIIDGKFAAKSRSGLVYTCLGGWIDLGHARPDGAATLWNKIANEIGTRSKDCTGFRVNYSQSMSRWGMKDGVTRDYYVKYKLTRCQKESVALAIFMELSLEFESLQASFPYSWVTDSGFSAEDLMSNLVGFYRAVRPCEEFISKLKPVSKEAADKIWEEYGKVGDNKNQHFGPFLYPCDECNNMLSGPVSGELPAFLRSICPAIKGGHFREWTKRT